MILITQKYKTQITTQLLNTLHLNFIILNNKLIFTHSINSQQLKDINKLLKSNYLKYKIIKK